MILNGHDHLYERFAPQDPEGPAITTGAGQFVVGTRRRRAGLHRLARRSAHTEYVDHRTFGALLMALRPSSYEWAFIGVDGGRARSLRGASQSWRSSQMRQRLERVWNDGQVTV